MQIIDGKRWADALLSQITSRIAHHLSDGHRAPVLRIIVVGEDAGSKVYVANKLRAAQQTGIQAQAIRLPDTTTTADLSALVEQLNNDSQTDGFIVQLPLPAHIDTNTVLALISPEKDMDRNIESNAVHNLLRLAQIDTNGRQLVVTENNRPNSLTANDIEEGSIVIDMGFTCINDPLSKKGYHIVGDVNRESIAHKAAYLAPVPGGVGPMIIATLLEHTLHAYEHTLR